LRIGRALRDFGAEKQPKRAHVDRHPGIEHNTSISQKYSGAHIQIMRGCPWETRGGKKTGVKAIKAGREGAEQRQLMNVIGAIETSEPRDCQEEPDQRSGRRGEKRQRTPSANAWFSAMARKSSTVAIAGAANQG
jgi:hypothetical protein